MSINITNLGGVVNYHDNHKEVTIHSTGNVSDIVRKFMADDVEPVQEESVESIIFTYKAKKEGKITAIIQALQNAITGRKDKTRAFVQELHVWQKDEYVDAHYNAQVMYDELAKLIPLPFGYEVFKKHYNNTRS